MQLFSIGAALAMALGLGGCAGMGHDMHGAHHDGMMGQHGEPNCPGADQAAHGVPSAGVGAGADAAHEHPAGAASECPPAAEQRPEQHEHGDTPPPN